MASNALEKSLQTLAAFKSDDSVLSVKEIAKRTGSTVSSIQRSVFTLEGMGYIERERGGKGYTLGRSCLRPAYGFLRGNRFLEITSPHLIELSSRLNARCDLTVLDGNEIVYLARFPSKDEAFNLSPLGRRWPATNTASGRAILSALPEGECDQIVQDHDYKKITPKTIIDKTAIQSLVEEARQDGYAYQLEEVLIGAASIGAPVFSGKGDVLGAILIGGGAKQFEDKEFRQTLGETIKLTAASITAYNI